MPPAARESEENVPPALLSAAEALAREAAAAARQAERTTRAGFPRTGVVVACPEALVPADWRPFMFETAEELAAAEAANAVGVSGPPPRGLNYAFVRRLGEGIRGSRLPHDHYHLAGQVAGWCGRRCPLQGDFCEGRCYRPVFPGVGSAHDSHDCTVCHRALGGGGRRGRRR